MNLIGHRPLSIVPFYVQIGLVRQTLVSTALAVSANKFSHFHILRVLNKNESYTSAHRFSCSSSFSYRLIALYECKRISIIAVMYFRYVLFLPFESNFSLFNVYLSFHFLLILIIRCTG